MNQLWAITSFFNPASYKRHLINYRSFREHLQVPLAAIELSFDGNFELESSDADILLRLNAGNIMWQKERLLNIISESIPEACD